MSDINAQINEALEMAKEYRQAAEENYRTREALLKVAETYESKANDLMWHLETGKPGA